MSFWKWPSILLLLFCIGIIVPYAQRSGGSNGLRGAVASVTLHGCPLYYQTAQTEDAIRVRARLAPECAVALTPPAAALLAADGETVSETQMRGVPNNLNAKLETAGQANPVLVFSAENRSGVTAQAVAPLTPAAPSPDQQGD